jgi:hypothetical protein
LSARAAAALLLLVLAGLRVHAGETAPAATDHRGKERLRILVFGDSGTGKSDQHEVGRHMAAECARRGGCDLALMLGDNLYGDGRLADDAEFDARFERPYEPLGTLEFWAVPGNHDWSSSERIAAEIAYTQRSPRWRMPARDFTVPLLPDWIRIHGVDTNTLARGRELDQVERAAAALCGRDGWKLLFGHHPVYTSGWHGDARGVYEKAAARLLEPLIERCGVQFYLSGHDHDQEHLSAPGFEQIVQGAAGKLRRIRTIDERPAGVVQRAGAALFGFALLEIGADALEVRFFGYGPGRPFAAWHCRSYARADFADPERRSRACATDDARDQIR